MEGKMYIHYFSSNYDIAQNISHIPSRRFLIHSHASYELHYVISGDMEIMYAGHITQVKSCGLTLIAPNVPHGIRVLSDKPYERYTAHFTEDLIPPRLRPLLLQLFSSELYPARNNHLKSMGTTNLLPIFQ